MYWYLSFLRPPPVSVSKGTKTITITPQVANDLRTEIRTEPTEIYYTWQHISAGQSRTLARLCTKPEHLTTYASPVSTYKSISVPFPTTAKAGQSWRLGLFPTDHGAGSQALGEVLKEGAQVLGVWSGPIEILGMEERQVKRAKLDAKDIQKSGKGKGKGKEKEDEGPKQTRIQREWTLGPKSEGEVQEMLRVVEQTSFDLDKKIWDSGLALAAWLRTELNSYRAGNVDEKTSHCLGLLSGYGEGQARRVLELGSGTGLVSIALRQYLARNDIQHDVEINATDLDSAMELMQENIDLNETRSTVVDDDDTEQGEKEVAHTATISAKTLDWDNPLPDWVVANHPDIVIAADVTYNTSSFPSLVNTLRNLLLPATGERPPLLLAYKQRDEAERELWGMLQKEGITLEKVDKIRGAEAEGFVEIWVGTATPK